MMIMILPLLFLHQIIYLGSQNHPLLSCLSLKDLGLVEKNLRQIEKQLGLAETYLDLVE